VPEEFGRDEAPRTPRLLHVDHSEATRTTVTRLLRNAGFDVIEAVTGAEAFEKLAFQPDVIVLDVRLPDIDGFEVCRRVKADPATAGIPVLHLSASYVSSDKKAEGLDAGADACLVRPVEAIELVATVNALLRQRRTEEALRQSESRFRLMADTAPVMIRIADATGLGTWYNRSWLEFVGGTMADELAGAWLDHVHPDDVERCREMDARHRETRTPFSIEYRLRRVDGEYRWLLDRCVPMWAGPDAGFSGCMSTAVDITDRRRSEAMLAESEARFRQLAGDRTRLLELERAVRRDAEEANRLKDEFLATLSHELRTPLNAIVGWTTLLQQTSVPETVLAEGIATIERNAKVQSRLIDDLLDVSRILSGKLRLDVQAVDLASIVESALRSVFPASAAKEIRVHRVLESGGETLMGDPARLQQVVWNLLSNAVKFTPRGGRVNVSLARSGSQLELVVEDNGQGIAPEFLPHVFDRFRQADASTTRSHTGLGLGLAIVRHLIEQHGGTVSAHSDGEGKGAAFSVRLPIMAAHQRDGKPTGATAAAGAQLAAKSADAALDLSDLRVLVVDDEPDSRDLLRRLLEQWHAAVQTGESVAAALSALARQPFDVVVSDIGMPGQDGYDLVRQLRALPGVTATTPIIALTAFARAEDRRRALRAGFQMHIAKPVDPAELLAAVATVSRRGHRH
jgi:PAS domain S-box-containing protein